MFAVTITSVSVNPTFEGAALILPVAGASLNIVGTQFVSEVGGTSFSLRSCASADAVPTTGCSGTMVNCGAATTSTTVSGTCTTPALAAGSTYQVIASTKAGSSASLVFITVSKFN